MSLRQLLVAASGAILSVLTPINALAQVFDAGFSASTSLGGGSGQVRSIAVQADTKVIIGG